MGKPGRSVYQQKLINMRSDRYTPQWMMIAKILHKIYMENQNEPASVYSIIAVADGLADFYEERLERFKREQFFEIIGIEDK